MEKLEYLIRTFTYKRSCLKQELKKEWFDSEILVKRGQIKVLNEVITEIYKLVENEKDNES